MNKFLIRIIFIPFALLASSAHAVVMTYTNSADWQTAVGSLSGTEDFNSFVTDAEFRTTTVSVNNMQISSGTGTNGTVTNKIDTTPYEFGGFFDGNGTPYLLGDLVSALNPDLRFDFTNGITAWGAEFQGIADTALRNTRLDVFDSLDNLLGSVALSSTSQTDVQFYGFEITGGAIADYMIFTNPDTYNDTFRIDDIGFVVATVPEPGTLALLGLGLAGIGFSRRKRLG